jgi:ribosomal protein S6--L-glutamate ligase
MNVSDVKKMIIGSEEWCAIPQLLMPAVKVRVDSGAKTLALHAFNIQPFKRENIAWVAFEVHPIQGNRKLILRCEAPVVDRRVVKNSSGQGEKRYVIKSLIRMSDQTWEIEITLTNRDSMGYRMLLGREAMNGRVLVDPSASMELGRISESDLIQMYGISQTPKSGLKIGLLASNRELYSNKRIMQAGEERGHDMRFYNIQDCYMKLDDERPEVHYRGGEIVSELDAVIPRIRPSATFYGCALTRQFESMGVYTQNSSLAISQSRDKLFSLQLLIKCGLDIPLTGFAYSPIDTNELIDMVGGAPLIVKLLEGSQGRGVVLAETRKAAESVINAFKAVKANLLVQEFIKEAGGKDLRLFVINGKVTAAIQREAAPGEFRANIHQGATATVVRVTADEKKLAVRAAKAMGLAVAGVDIIRSKTGPLLLEVNSSPGLEGIEGATEKDVAKMMIQAIEQELKWKSAD